MRVHAEESAHVIRRLESRFPQARKASSATRSRTVGHCVVARLSVTTESVRAMGSVQASEYDELVHAPTDHHDWLAIDTTPLPVGDAYEWAVRPDCGAVVVFSGTVRDNAEGRSDVRALTYEAYAEAVVPRFGEIAGEMRKRWPSVGRIAILHRVGELQVGESSVVVVVSSPHRPEAFEAARYGIDALKASAPIWKKEHWKDGSAWGTGAHVVVSPADVPSAPYATHPHDLGVSGA